MTRYDAIIVGGGPAGAACGIMLSDAGWRVAVVEKRAFPRPKVCGEFISASNASLLAELGIADAFATRAGPGVRRVGLYAGDAMLSSRMPENRGTPAKWGRALGREALDLLLLERAAANGADLRQPCGAVELRPGEAGFAVTVATGSREETLHAPVAVAAHGSWERSGSPTEVPEPHRASDLLAFKAHFRDCALPVDLMPLLAFPGGYGGMVHSDDGRVSLSFCMRRDELRRRRAASPGLSAGDVVRRHIETSCLGVREALSDARLDGRWLSAGPIRPGIRGGYRNGVFLVGNAAGEAHPVVAEGISMALQSAYLLSRRLIENGDARAGRGLPAIGRDYCTEWQARFGSRIRAAALFAHLAMRPGSAHALLPLLKRFPAILTFGASLSGKTRLLDTAASPSTERAA